MVATQNGVENDHISPNIGFKFLMWYDPMIQWPESASGQTLIPITKNRCTKAEVIPAKAGIQTSDWGTWIPDRGRE